MVIRKSDRVSAVLTHDESLVDVFVSLSPAFERLRNPGMRKVMARLVTVEQAARMAGIDADELVRRLNDGASADGPVHAADGAAEAAHSADHAPAAPAALRHLTWDRIVTVDVREDLRSGKEPFSRIMAARRTVPEGGALCVRAIFEPVPLYAVMARHGYAHFTERLADDDWQVCFYAAEASPRGTAPSAVPASGQASDEDAGGDDVVVLDVRDLEPPEPMVRTLAALDALPPGATLVQINVRVPQFLLPRLAERGFAYEIREQAPDLVRVFIRRAPAEP